MIVTIGLLCSALGLSVSVVELFLERRRLVKERDLALERIRVITEQRDWSFRSRDDMIRVVMFLRDGVDVLSKVALDRR